jgi:hypothetical protein
MLRPRRREQIDCRDAALRPGPARRLLGDGLLLVASALGRMAPGLAKAADIDWPEAVDRLAHERSLAETCVASLKGHGDAQQISRGQLAYGEAKSNFDAVIAGLITALGEGETPNALPDLQSDLAQGAWSLENFCKTVSDLLPAEPGQRA